MALNNVKFFADDNHFVSLVELTNVNIVTIGPLDYAVTSTGENNNPVYCSFRGKYLKQVSMSDIDNEENIDCFCYETDKVGRCYVNLIVDKNEVFNIPQAKCAIRGLLVDYKLANITGTGTTREPLFELTTYLSDGTLVSPTIGMSLGDILKKIMCFETNFDINEAGYYNHVIRRAIVRE